MKPSGKTPAKMPTLDLHGYITDEVYDALESFLRKHESAKTVRIMPGKGTGKVKALVVQYLKQANYPWSHERMGNGQENEGVLVVYMD